MAKLVYTLLQLYKNPKKNRLLGITYEVIYIPPDIKKRLEEKG